MKKKIIIALASLIAVCLILSYLTALVIPKYTDPISRDGALIPEYYLEDGGHDVVFIGDCEVYESIVPAVLWEKYGINSYVRGSPQQLAWQSYYLLEETLGIEKPKAVVFNVMALKYGTPQEEKYNRMTLDRMRWSSSKLSSIFASMTEDEHFIEYLFPILRFHSRITELTSDDFKYAYDTPQVSHNGYLMYKNVDAQVDFSEGKMLVDYTLPENAIRYLDMMRELCEEQGVELILMKAPTNAQKFWWYDEWDEQVTEYAEKNSLAYYNFIPLADQIGLDWTLDTHDKGLHLNVYGAEKFTEYFGKILSEEHGLSDRRAESDLAALWQEKLDRYYSERNS